MEGRRKNCMYTEYMALNAGMERARTMILDRRVKDVKRSATAPYTANNNNNDHLALTSQENNDSKHFGVTGKDQPPNGRIVQSSHAYLSRATKSGQGSSFADINGVVNLPFLDVSPLPRRRSVKTGYVHGAVHSAPQVRQSVTYRHHADLTGRGNVRARSSGLDVRAGLTTANSMMASFPPNPLERLKMKLNLPSANTRRPRKVASGISNHSRREQVRQQESLGTNESDTHVMASEMLGITRVCFPILADRCINKLIVYDPRRIDRQNISRRDMHYVSFSAPIQVPSKSSDPHSRLGQRQCTDLELIKQSMIAGNDSRLNHARSQQSVRQQVPQRDRIQSAETYDEGLGDEI